MLPTTMREKTGKNRIIELIRTKGSKLMILNSQESGGSPNRNLRQRRTDHLPNLVGNLKSSGIKAKIRGYMIAYSGKRSNRNDIAFNNRTIRHHTFDQSLPSRRIVRIFRISVEEESNQSDNLLFDDHYETKNIRIKQAK